VPPWGENYFPWKMIFHPLLCQTTENWKTIFWKNHSPPPNKHYCSEVRAWRGYWWPW